MGALVRVIAVMAVAVLSACTSRVGGTPVTETTLPPELTAESAFADIRTVDPCSLTSPDVFDTFGLAVHTLPESLEFCAIRVSTPDGEVRIHVGAFGGLATNPELRDKRVKDVERGLWVGQLTDTPSFCRQALVFPDDVLMLVQGQASDRGDADACPVVEAGMDHAIEVILDDGVGHRTPERDSLMLIDPCSLVDDADVGAIAGLAGARRSEVYPARHDCFWKVGSEVTVLIRFRVGLKPAGANEDPVAGRPTATNPAPEQGTGSSCAVETAHLPFTDDVFELAGVYVRMPKGQVDAGCAAARAVAELVWPKLPTP